MGRPKKEAQRARRNAFWSLKYRQNGLCFWCKQPILFDYFNDSLSHLEQMTAEHYPIKYADGGTSDKDNIWAVHFKCQDEKRRARAILEAGEENGKEPIH